MNKILKRLRLTDSFSIELNVSPEDLINYLKGITSKLGLLSIFSFDDKEFEGEITKDKFYIERKATFPNTVTWAAAHGHIIRSSDKLVVNIQLRPTYKYFLLINFIVGSFIFVFIGLPLSIGEFIEGEYLSGFIGIVIFGLLFSVGVLYPLWLVRRGVLNLRYDLEQELIKLKRKHRLS